MDTNAFLDMLRTAPWVVWLVCVPSVVVVRNQGLRLVQRARRQRVPDSHRPMWLTLATLLICVSIIALGAIAHRLLSV